MIKNNYGTKALIFISLVPYCVFQMVLWHQWNLLKDRPFKFLYGVIRTVSIGLSSNDPARAGGIYPRNIPLVSVEVLRYD
jgi:hypothetical protein